MLKRYFTIIFLTGALQMSGQTIGGTSVYNFLNLPSSPQLTAEGGVNTSYQPGDVTVSANNPALLIPMLHSQLGMSFNGFLGGIKAYSASTAMYKEKYETTFGAHVYLIDYGSIPQTDVSGNVSGTFHPMDFVVQVSAARQYLKKWHYGMTLKFINSVYPPYSSKAIASDVGVVYQDSSRFLSIGLLARNMGFQLRGYDNEKEDLPFDLQAGITKRLSNAPFGFSVTVQHLHQLNIAYNDTAFNQDSDLSGHAGFVSRIFNHFVFATHIYLGSNLELTAGYNFLRRNELNIGSGGNGLNGFSGGLTARFQKLQVMYAISAYQHNVFYNQLGLGLWLNRLVGLGD